MLKTLRLRYDPQEDRIVLFLTLSVEPQQDRVHVLQLTRRLCAAWRRDLQALVDLSAQAPEGLDAAARAAVSRSHHEAQARQVPIRSEPAASFQAQPSTGLPLLVTQITSGRKRGDPRWVVRFAFEQAPTLSLLLSARTLHGLVDALARRIKVADWNLESMPSEQPLEVDRALLARFH